MRINFLKILYLLLLFALCPGTAIADIASNFGLGANALSMSGAYTGVADDFSACYYNAAGLAYQRRPAFAHDRRGTSLYIGAGYASTSLWTKDPSAGLSRANISPVSFEQLGLTVGPSALGGILPERRLYFGFAFYSPSDAIIGWKQRNTASDRYFVFYDNQNRIFGFLADAAYRFSDHLSIGAGATILAASRTITNVNFLQSGFSHTEDNVILIKAAPVAGIMIIMPGDLKIGFNYRGKIKFSDYGVNNLSASGLPIYTQIFDYTRFFSPEQYSFGVSYQFKDPFLLLSADATYVNWSSFVDEQGDGVPQTRLFDTVVPRLGLRYGVRNNIDVSAGYAFLRSPVRDQTGVTNFLDSNRHLLSAGAGYTFEKAGFWHNPITLSAYVQDTLFQDRDVHKTQTVDQYQQGYSFGGHVLDAGIQFRFVW
jgi:long-subunit fatty acid transport protein